MSDEMKFPGESAVMNHARPLDSLMPELVDSRAPLRIEPLHQRVLEVETEEGWEWLLACWRDPGGAQALHNALKNLVEATLLAALSAPPRRGVEVLSRPFSAIRLMIFDAIPNVGDAVRAFGFEPLGYKAEAYAERMPVLREEAERMGWGALGEPQAVYAASIVRNARYPELQAQLVSALGEEDWGSDPGRPSKLLAEALASRGVLGLVPDLASLDVLEAALVSRETGVIRWMSPMAFQGLCDFIGVVIQQLYEVDVLWAVCEEDSFGMCPPPLLRVAWPDGRVEHLPLGLLVLRWCVMPIGSEEDVPPLSAWIEGEFTGA